MAYYICPPCGMTYKGENHEDCPVLVKKHLQMQKYESDIEKTKKTLARKERLLEKLEKHIESSTKTAVENSLTENFPEEPVKKKKSKKNLRFDDEVIIIKLINGRRKLESLGSARGDV